MKKILLYIVIAIAAFGCTKDETTSNTAAEGAISFSAGVTTRVSSSDDCLWDSTNDKIGVFTNQSSDSQNMLFTVDDNGDMTEDKSVPVLYTLPSGKRRYYAYHPYDAALSESSTKITCELAKPYSDYLLYATTTSNDKVVTLQFKHMFSKVTFNLTAGSAEVTTLKGATVWLSGTPSNSTFDIESGEFTDNATVDIPLTITEGDNGVYSVTANLLPTAKGNAKLWVTGADSKVNTFVKSIDEAWESGGSYTYDLTVGEKISIGDFVYSDGTHSSTLDSAKSCVGVVFLLRTDATESTDVTDNCDYGVFEGTPTGYIVSIDQNTSVWATSNASGTDSSSEINGYTCTNSHYSSFGVNGTIGDKGLIAIPWCLEHTKIKDTGYLTYSSWYMPSLKEYEAMSKSLSTLQASLDAITAADKFGTDNYSTSGLMGMNGQYLYLHNVNSGNSSNIDNGQQRSHPYRAVCAFK